MQKATMTAIMPANIISGRAIMLGSDAARCARALDLIFISNAETSAAGEIWR
ncbi:MAG: hypothetical protein ACLQL2_08595 [Methylovirgula sp.]